MLNLITTLFTDQLITALCNTLVYSLLAGVFLATAGGIIIMLTNKLSAATRYNWLTAALGVFTVSMVVVFVMQFGNSRPLATAPAINIAADNFSVTVPANPAPVFDRQIRGALIEKSYIDVIANYLNTHHDIIVLIWFFVICVKGVQLMAGLRGVYRLKYRDVNTVTESWNNELKRMADSLGIRQKVTLLASGLAKVPMAIGYLRPVILMPVGLLAALSMDEVEAILLHELAHIRRRDYLINLLQSLLEIVGFFYPSVLWVSQLIKTEREHCCDDIALGQNGSKAGYIKALINCEEYRAAAPGYAMAMSGNRNNLLARVRRLATNHNNGLNTFEKTLFTVCLIISGICFSAFASKQPIKAVADRVIAAIMPKDKKADEHQPSPLVDNGAAENIDKENIVQTKADEQAAPDVVANGTKPGAPLDSAQLKAMDDAWVKMLIRTDSALKAKSDEEWPKMNPQVSGSVQRGLAAKRQYIFNHIQLEIINDGLPGHKPGSLSTLSFAVNENDFIVNGQKQPEALHKKYLALLQSVPGTFNYSVNYDSKTTVNKNDNADSNTNANNNQAANNNVNISAPLPPTAPAGDNYLIAAAKEKKRAALFNDLLTDGLVKNVKKISFALTDDKFILNGATQAAKIHQKYKAKYLTGRLMSWQYSGNGNSANGSTSEAFGERSETVSKLDSVTKRHYKVHAYGIFKMDSMYRARGYNDAKHMAADRAPDTNYVPRPTVTRLLMEEMWRDSLMSKSKPRPFSIGAKDSSFIIDGRRQSPAIARKYLAIVKKFQDEHPAPVRPVNASDELIRERNRYLSNRIVVKLLNDGLTKDGADLWLTFNSKVLILNGVPQSAEIFQSYFDELLKPVPANSRISFGINEVMGQ